MVLLSRIYTKAGDRGMTALGTGRRVRKDDPRVEACGDVDELNAVIGLARAAGLRGAADRMLRAVQNDLFDLGADLTLPAARRGRARGGRAPLRITASHTARLERSIDRLNAGLGILRSFVLPGGSPDSAWLHVARTVCRRAERRVVALARRGPVNPEAIVYLNRLSDMLFVMARHANSRGRRDVLWVPGAGKDQGISSPAAPAAAPAGHGSAPLARRSPRFASRRPPR